MSETKVGWVERGQLPWKQLNTSGVITDAGDEPVVVCLVCPEVVLHRMNHFDALVEALRDARNSIDGDVDYFDLRDRIDAALRAIGATAKQPIESEGEWQKS